MQKITPFLWFDSQAEEAVAFYLSVFKDGKIHTTTRYPEGGRGPTGTVRVNAYGPPWLRRGTDRMRERSLHETQLFCGIA